MSLLQHRGKRSWRRSGLRAARLVTANWQISVIDRPLLSSCISQACHDTMHAGGLRGDPPAQRREGDGAEAEGASPVRRRIIHMTCLHKKIDCLHPSCLMHSALPARCTHSRRQRASEFDEKAKTAGMDVSGFDPSIMDFLTGAARFACISPHMCPRRPEQ